MKIYYEVKPKHYVGGVSITISYPDGILTMKDKSIIEEKLAEAAQEIVKSKII